MATTVDYIEPTGHSLAFTLHISGENYSYVIGEAKRRGIPRNRVINEILAEHRALRGADRVGSRTLGGKTRDPRPSAPRTAK